MYASTYSPDDPFGLGATIGGMAASAAAGGVGRQAGASGALSSIVDPAAIQAPEANAFLGLGAISSVAGAVFGALGTLQSVRSSKHQALQAAMEAEFRSTIAASNARMAEQDAQDQRDAGDKQLSMVRRQYALAEGEQKVSQAASGTYGETYDTARAALRASAKIDAMTVRRNTARAVAAQRVQAVNLRNEAALGGVTARNLRATAGTINPALPTFASVLAGAGQAAGPLYTYSRR